MRKKIIFLTCIAIVLLCAGCPNDVGIVAPTNLIVTDVTSSEIVLSWEYGSGACGGFNIERRPSDFGEYQVIDYVTTDARSYTDSYIFSGTKYCYRVSSPNSGDPLYSNVVEVESKSADDTYTLSGTLCFSTTPITNFNIKIRGNNTETSRSCIVMNETQTDANGNYSFSDVPSGQGDYYLSWDSPFYDSDDYSQFYSIDIDHEDTTLDVYAYKIMASTSPIDESVLTDNSIEFKWEGLDEASTYDLTILSSYTGFREYKDLTTTSVTLDLTLESDVEYQWYVTAYDYTGIRLNFKSYYSFTYKPLL